MHIVLYYVFGMHVTGTDTAGQLVASCFPRDYASVALTQAAPIMPHARMQKYMSGICQQLSAQMLVTIYTSSKLTLSVDRE